MNVLSQRLICSYFVLDSFTSRFKGSFVFSNEALTVSLVENFQRQRCEWATT